MARGFLARRRAKKLRQAVDDSQAAQALAKAAIKKGLAKHAAEEEAQAAMGGAAECQNCLVPYTGGDDATGTTDAEESSTDVKDTKIDSTALIKVVRDIVSLDTRLAKVGDDTLAVLGDRRIMK